MITIWKTTMQLLGVRKILHLRGTIKMYGRTPSSVSANGRWQPPGQVTPGRGERGRKTRRKLQNIKHLNFPRGNNSNTRRWKTEAFSEGLSWKRGKRGKQQKRTSKYL